MRGWAQATRFAAWPPAKPLAHQHNVRLRPSFKCFFPFLQMMRPEFDGSGKFLFPRDSNGCRKETRLRFRSKQSRQHPLLRKRSLAAEDLHPRSTSSNDRGHFIESWDGRYREHHRFLTTIYCRRSVFCTHHGTLVQSADGDRRDLELWDVPSQ